MKRINIYLGLFLFVFSAKSKVSVDRPNALKELVNYHPSTYMRIVICK